MPGEFEFIQWIKGQVARHPSVRLGLGDDLAVLAWDAADLLIVGVDQVLDGVHFDSAIHPPEAIGRKVMNRNLSDCAAMACLPAGCVATVALPRGRGIDYAQALFAGMKSAADAFDCPIVGGDTASWDGKLAMTAAILGRSAGINPITRSGARPGDGIYVTGPLGGSILGRHMNFVPRVHEARELAKTGAITAMIDLSDGLSRDLRQICQASGVGAAIESSKIPVSPDAIELSRRDGVAPIEHAVNDGEDHELLFCASSGPPTGARIGTITAAAGVCDMDGKITLADRGWEHDL